LQSAKFLQMPTADFRDIRRLLLSCVVGELAQCAQCYSLDPKALTMPRDTFFKAFS
jgi:hypothetical protein